MGVKNRYSFNSPAKVLGCFHAALGGLLFIFGIVARIQVHHWTSIMVIGIWTGVLMMGTGAVGVMGAYRRMNARKKKYFIIWFVFMSIIALLASLIVVVCYVIALQEFFFDKKVADFDWFDLDDQTQLKLQNQDRARGITATILALGIFELLISFISLIHGLLCCCCRKWHQTKHQELYDRNSIHSDR